MTLQRTPALAYNSSGYDNHLMFPKIGGKFKECNFLRVGENTEKFIFFAQKKDWKRKNIMVKSF